MCMLIINICGQHAAKDCSIENKPDLLDNKAQRQNQVLPRPITTINNTTYFCECNWHMA